ncbi:tetratricopeptide repeat protein [Pseudomonas sp. RAC1]|uniref:tetratricopeptide repeat protein n=2 Tax=Pseudomonas TaxID=286 RepID=UPI00271EB1E9|nr:tetratricopeptide repeat protein [Pseudomonas sp. RAC1]MDV9033635.1 tetratricopeptide repeat protein [Pseudomonas sp. RAC1]
MRPILWLLLLLSTGASAALAPSPVRDLRVGLERADKAMADADYRVAYQEYSLHADNNGLAQFALGLIEQRGWGRPADPTAACGWFGRAAHASIPTAQQFYGDCYAQGIGLAVDGQAALKWYQAAVNGGLVAAACAAGQLYIEGRLVDKDIPRGLALCTSTAQAQSTPAMMTLAAYYQKGSEVPQNLTLARFWYEQAAQRHVHEAQFQLGLMLSEGQGGEADPQNARFWLEHAAMEGYAPAYLATAILYANAPVDPQTGVLTPKDLAKIYMWNSAAKSATHNQQQLAEIERIEKLVLAVMPEQWKPELDRRVAEHLANASKPDAIAQ